jgi:hypothetical protein
MARPFLVPFRRLLWLAGSRWRYSTPPPHGFSGSFTNSCSGSKGWTWGELNVSVCPLLGRYHKYAEVSVVFLIFICLPVCLCTWNSSTVLLTGLWRPLSEVSLDSYSLLNVACGVSLPFPFKQFWCRWNQILCKLNSVSEKLAAKILMELLSCLQLVTGTLIRTKNLNY